MSKMAFLGRLLKYCFKGVISLELPRCLQGEEVQHGWGSNAGGNFEILLESENFRRIKTREKE